jgi:hypothetical protein
MSAAAAAMSYSKQPADGSGAGRNPNQINNICGERFISRRIAL